MHKSVLEEILEANKQKKCFPQNSRMKLYEEITSLSRGQVLKIHMPYYLEKWWMAPLSIVIRRPSQEACLIGIILGPTRQNGPISNAYWTVYICCYYCKEFKDYTKKSKIVLYILILSLVDVWLAETL